MSKNPTAGIGDPYWYEWSVGLDVMIDMLNPDSDIASVTLQTTQVQGIDDVIVHYINGTVRCIQVKHSRSDDTLTFGDMVAASDSKESLLSHLATAWKEATDTGWDCEAVLYTNRPGSSRSYTVENTVTGERFQRPALVAFWDMLQTQLPTVTSLTDITVPEEWAEAWEEWCSQLHVIEYGARLTFLRSLDIVSDGPDLDELESQLLRKIAGAFAVSPERASSVLSSLYRKLSIWTTSRRDNEAVRREDVFSAISAGEEDMVGDHMLPPPEPLFPSRLQFVEDLAATLLQGPNPVVFLTGAPGRGKTSVINSLANRHDPVIDLRYHAFRPITPDSTLIPADVSRTATGRALWGDLLAQLRVIFAGRLAKFRVPVRNDLLDTVDQLRDHVLRLAKELANERGRPTIIAIDGLDHAARAGLLRSAQLGPHASLLESLVSPEAVPEGVCFLIAGQPAGSFETYPFWLKSPREDVTVCTVPDLSYEDIEALVHATSLSIPEDQMDSAIRVIHAAASGNTLSAVFAAHEAKSCPDILTLEERLGSRRLADGISAYYDEIWRAALRPLTAHSPFVGHKLAAVISLAAERLSSEFLSGLFPEFSRVDWQEAMRALSPVVVEDSGGFRVFHNDVRVYLTGIISGSPQRLVEVASKMADFYIQAAEGSIPRHAELFRLLAVSGRQKDHATVFTPDFVLEGWALGRPMFELIDQARQAVQAVPSVKDWGVVHRVACALFTLNQLRKTLQWSDRDESTNVPSNELPPVLLAEGRVVPKTAWSLDLIDGVLDDAMSLIEAREITRARGLMNRWFQTLSPVEVLGLVPEAEKRESRPGAREDETALSDATVGVFRKWGAVSLSTGTLWDSGRCLSPTEEESRALAAFFSGRLLEASRGSGALTWAHSLRVDVFFLDDMEEAIEALADKRHWLQVAFGLRRIQSQRSNFSRTFLVQAATWALLCNGRDLFEVWVRPVLEEGFTDLRPDRPDRYADELHNFIRVCFILGWNASARPAAAIAAEASKAYYSRNHDERQKSNVVRLMRAGVVMGRLLGACITKGKDYVSEALDPKELGDVLQAILAPESRPVAYPSGYHEMTAELLEVAIECGTRAGGRFDGIVARALFYHAEAFPFDATLEPTWRFVATRGGTDLLQRWFRHWLADDGAAWSMDVAERLEIIERLSVLARELGWISEVQQVERRQRWCWVGYSGHKEYALGEPLRWYEDLARLSPASWQDYGVRLLSVSEHASQTGDNRYSHDVIESVATAAARCGPAATWTLLNCGSTKAVTHWMGKRDSGIIESMAGLVGSQGEVLSEKDLLVIWCVAMGSSAWEVEHEQAILSRVRQALAHEANRRGLHSLGARMKVLGPAEYGAHRSRDEQTSVGESAPSLVDKVRSSTIDAAITLVTDHIRSVPHVSTDEWLAVAACLMRLREERPADFQQHLKALDKIIWSHSKPYGWTYNGMYHAIDALVRVLDETSCNTLVDDTVAALDLNGSSEIWGAAAAENLDLLCLYHARVVGELELRQGLDRLLCTHEKWAEGGGHLPALNRPVLNDHLDTPDTWSDFGYRFLLRTINCSNSSFTIAAALRGLWALAQVAPEDLVIVCKTWQRLTERAREWVLLVAERIAAADPRSFLLIEPVVTESYLSATLTIRLQAWAALKAYERNGGPTCPTWPTSGQTFVNSGPCLTVPNAATLLTVPGTPRGRSVFGQGASAVLGVLGRLEKVTEGNVSDLETRLAESLRTCPVDHSERQRSREDRNSDLLIVRRPELDRLGQLINCDLQEGRWSDVPTVKLAQALLTSNDPWVLLNTPTPQDSSSSTWPCEETLDELLASVHGGSDLERKLLEILVAGLEAGQVLLGGRLLTYSKRWDVELSLDFLWKRDKFDLSLIDRTATFNGRTFASYTAERFEPLVDPQGGWLTLDVLHREEFMNQSVQCIPSMLFQDISGWTPSPNDPLIWLEEGRKVMEMQRKLGPVRSAPWDLPGRQPQMQRWVVERSGMDRIRSRLGGALSMRNHLQTWPFHK